MYSFVIVQNSLRTTYGFRLGYIKKLLKTGKVTVIAPNDDSEVYAKFEALGVKVIAIPTFGSSIFDKILCILHMNYQVLRHRSENSIFVCHFLVTFLMVYISLIPFNKKCVLYVEGLGSIFSHHDKLRKILKILMSKRNLVRLFCNENERLLLGIKSDSITHGIGIDLARFKKQSRLYRETSERRLLYVGRLINDKGVKDAIDTFRLLIKSGENYRLTLVGDIYPSNPSSLSVDEIETLQEEFGDHIAFVGYTNDIERWYLQSDVLIIPSVREGFPVCVMEASAAGVPTVGYNVPGMIDAVKQNVNGILVPFKDIEALASAVEMVFEVSNRVHFASSSKDYAENNFCNIEKSSQLVNVLYELASKK